MIAARAGTPCQRSARPRREGAGAALRADRIIGRFSAAGASRPSAAVAAMNISGPAPHHGGRGARQPDRHALRQRTRRGGQVRRTGDEECHGPRPRQADGRLLGHARLHDRGHLQGAAEARTHGDAALAWPRRPPGNRDALLSRRSAFAFRVSRARRISRSAMCTSAAAR